MTSQWGRSGARSVASRLLRYWAAWSFIARRVLRSRDLHDDVAVVTGGAAVASPLGEKRHDGVEPVLSPVPAIGYSPIGLQDEFGGLEGRVDVDGR